MSEHATLFADAPGAPRSLPEVHGDAALSDCGQFRWWLRRWWRAGPPVCWIMLNPSTADASKNDPTLLRVIHFTRSWGYGGLVVVNLYPFRTPNPAACRKWSGWLNNGPDYYARDRLHQNLNIVAEKAREAALVVAAWGAGAWDEMWVDHLIEEVQCEEPFPALWCLGKTAGGDPKHPLARDMHRVPDDQRPVLWRKSP